MKERMDGRVEGGEGEEGLNGGSGEGKGTFEDVGKGDREGIWEDGSREMD